MERLDRASGWIRPHAAFPAALPRACKRAILIGMTVTVELINEGAMNLLRDMESLGLLRILHINGKKPQPRARTIAPTPQDVESVCPICAQYYDPATESPPYNAETMAAIAEGDAMLRGEIPSKTFHSLDELLAELRS